MSPITVHLICNAHLDPVWQWRWDEGALRGAGHLSNAVDILKVPPFARSPPTTRRSFTHGRNVSIRALLRTSAAPRTAVRRSGGWFHSAQHQRDGVAGPGRSPRALLRDRLSVTYNFDSSVSAAACPRSCAWPVTGCTSTCGHRPMPADLYRYERQRRRHDHPGLSHRRRALPHRARQYRGAPAGRRRARPQARPRRARFLGPRQPRRRRDAPRPRGDRRLYGPRDARPYRPQHAGPVL